MAGTSTTRFYTSPFPRAQATAAILQQAFGRPAQILEEAYEVTPIPLREHRFALPLRWHFRLAYILMLWPRRQPPSWWWHYARAHRVWQQLIGEGDGDVVLVAHGWLIGMLIFSLIGNRQWRLITHDLSNCGITLIERRS